ncbi:MAG TPA: DinB family protein [Thermoanaerobaculia bacterium]|jgi:uncharacterized damage-inducible protein DinB
MNPSDIRRLYAYTDWANERFLGAMAALSEEQFTRAIVSSYPSVRETIAHVAGSEWLWLQRWKGESPTEPPPWLDAPSLDALAAELRANAREREQWLGALSDHALDVVLHYRSLKGDPFAMPLRDTLVHCANHSTYHRGQLVTMLRQVGATPPGTDYTLFVRATTS